MLDYQPRHYEAILANHFSHHRQMALLSGPRQVGKSTLCKRVTFGRVMNWDHPDHRRMVLAGIETLAAHFDLAQLRERLPVIGFDELHKYGKWKAFLKGLFDTYGEQARILVTGSSRLDVFRRGGDSLMGRYFLFHMHPFSVGELVRPELPDVLVRSPRRLKHSEWEALWNYGGYPEPFLKRDRRFHLRWQELRWQQLLREDIRDLTRIQELGQLEVLARLLAERSGGSLNYSNLAGEIQVSVDTVRRWVETLCSLHFGFIVRPWFRHVAKSLRKEPKWFLSDWAGIEDPGARAETFVACHLLKAVHGWQDLGLGQFELRYLRDKQQREVDFIIIKDRQPWFLVEVKYSDKKLVPGLGYFQAQLQAPHAFQAVLDMDYVEADCFHEHRPMVVPAHTLLSQLI